MENTKSFIVTNILDIFNQYLGACIQKVPYVSGECIVPVNWDLDVETTAFCKYARSFDDDNFTCAHCNPCCGDNVERIRIMCLMQAREYDLAIAQIKSLIGNVLKGVEPPVDVTRKITLKRINDALNRIIQLQAPNGFVNEYMYQAFMADRIMAFDVIRDIDEFVDFAYDVPDIMIPNELDIVQVTKDPLLEVPASIPTPAADNTKSAGNGMLIFLFIIILLVTFVIITRVVINNFYKKISQDNK
jgi:hypothetical protein